MSIPQACTDPLTVRFAVQVFAAYLLCFSPFHFHTRSVSSTVQYLTLRWKRIDYNALHLYDSTNRVSLVSNAQRRSHGPKQVIEGGISPDAVGTMG
jgi:hypothetical protein